jgi:hypothetical protein
VPCTTTSALETPKASTRFDMMVRASFIEDLAGALPVGVRALNTTWVPPARSMPSLGPWDLPGMNTSAYRMTKIARSERK